MSGRPRRWLLAFLLGASGFVLSGGSAIYHTLFLRSAQLSPEVQRFAASAFQPSQTASSAGFAVGALLAGLAIVRLPRKTLFLASFTAAGLGTLLVFFAGTRNVAVAVFGAVVLSAAPGWFLPIAVVVLAEAHGVRRRALSLLILLSGLKMSSPVFRMVSLVVFRIPHAVVSEIREWQLLMLVLGGATLLFGITLYKILFSGAVPIAPESAPDPDAGSLRNWFPGHVAAGCVLGGAIAVLMEPLRQIGSRSMYAQLIRAAGANRELLDNVFTKIGMLEFAVPLTTLLGGLAGAIYGDRLSGKSWKGHVVFLFPALAAGPMFVHYLGSTQFSLTVGLAAVVYAAAVGLFGSNLFAAVLDVTAAGNWAKAIALLAAVQSVAPLSLSYAVSTPLLLPVSGWTACLYMIWAIRKWTPTARTALSQTAAEGFGA